MREKYYDCETKTLLYVAEQADEEFWDRKWKESATKTFASPPRHGKSVSLTKKYIPEGGRVLEGGCGLGDVVRALHYAGFNAEGIDYAPKVVQAINSNWPELKVSSGDVRKIPAPDEYYDGYWSIGVIEHFPDGYDAIADEMHRVIKKGGVLFLSFPSFNQFRQRYAKKGNYHKLDQPANSLPTFYQYALDAEKVLSDFEKRGFKCIKRLGVASLQTLSEDTRWGAKLERFLNIVHPRFETIVSMAMDMVLGRFLGHSTILILKKSAG